MTSFWLKRILVMVAVIFAAIAFLIFMPEPGSSTTSSSGSSNSVADSVSRFYAEFRLTSRDPIKERYGEYVVVLDNQDQSVEEQVAEASDEFYQPMSDWQGEMKQRAFASGSTIMAEATNYVTAEGFQLVWALNQDFIIRDRFLSNNTLVGMLEEIAGAVDANFDHPIMIYFCYQKRALVITDKQTDFLINNCEKSQNSLQQF